MKKIKSFIVGLLIVAGFVGAPLATAVPTFAAAPINPQQQACLGTGGTWSGGKCTGNSSQGNLNSLIATLVNILLYVIGAIAVIMIIVGGFRYVTSGGNASSITAAKNTILYAVVGLVIAILAYAIVNFVTKALH